MTSVRTAADVIGALLRESDFPSLASIADASSLSKPTVSRWRDDHSGSITQDQLADLLWELGRSPEQYGVLPSLAWQARAAQREQRALAPWTARMEAILRRIDETTSLAPDLELRMADMNRMLLAVIDHFEIPIPDELRISGAIRP